MNTQNRKLKTDFPPSLASAHPVSRTDGQLAEEQVGRVTGSPKGVWGEKLRGLALAFQDTRRRPGRLSARTSSRAGEQRRLDGRMGEN